VSCVYKLTLRNAFVQVTTFLLRIPFPPGTLVKTGRVHMSSANNTVRFSSHMAGDAS